MSEPPHKHPHGFPTTQLSTVLLAAAEDPEQQARAYEALAHAYWMPVYKYIRIKWNKPTEDAKDLTQGFFAAAIEQNFFRRYDPARAKFRTFLRTCVDGFVMNADKAAQRQKRGGGFVIESLDWDSAETQLQKQLPVTTPSFDEFFEGEWVRNLVSLALRDLQERLAGTGREMHFVLFERYVLGEPEEQDRISYKDLAAEFELSVTSVTNYLASARREFRKALLDRLREFTLTEDEFRREARSLFGIDD